MQGGFWRFGMGRISLSEQFFWRLLLCFLGGSLARERERDGVVGVVFLSQRGRRYEWWCCCATKEKGAGEVSETEEWEQKRKRKRDYYPSHGCGTFWTGFCWCCCIVEREGGREGERLGAFLQGRHVALVVIILFRGGTQGGERWEKRVEKKRGYVVLLWGVACTVVDVAAAEQSGVFLWKHERYTPLTLSTTTTFFFYAWVLFVVVVRGDGDGEGVGKQSREKGRKMINSGVLRDCKSESARMRGMENVR